jgi:cytochrome P450
VASYLVHGPVEFSDLELVAILSNLLLGGVETTAATFVNALLYLEHHRSVRAELIAAPDLMRSAVKEFLRYFTPIMYAARTVTRDTSLAGVEFAEGDRVMLCLQAANHDPEAFDSTDVIRIDREQHVDVAFGFGVHRCLGHILGETQLSVMLGEFLRQAPGYRIDAARARRNDHPGTFNEWLAMPCVAAP